MIVALLTDYGLEDCFVAACHGAIAAVDAALRVLDVTHLVPPGDVRRGAAVLADTVPALPPAVVVGVVDPGVGTARRAIVIEAGPHLLVGPDNGLLLEAADALGGPVRAHEITARELMAPAVTATFHGRDVFAPVAARLAGGTPLTAVGPGCDLAGLVRLPALAVRYGAGWIEAEVRTVDRFGTAQTAATAAELAGAGLRAGTRLRVRAGSVSHDAVLAGTFADVAAGGLVALIDSAGRLAVAVNQGRAATRLAIDPGALVRLEADPG
jgi:S-adenosylmethionine hydrolase